MKLFGVTYSLAINQLGVYLPNTDKYIKYCLNSVSNLVDENVRVTATKALPHLLACIKQSNRDPNGRMLKSLANIMIKLTVFSCTLEIKPKVICTKLESMCEILVLVGVKTFSPTQIHEIYKTLLQIMSKFEVKTTTLKYNVSQQSGPNS